MCHCGEYQDICTSPVCSCFVVVLGIPSLKGCRRGKYRLVNKPEARRAVATALSARNINNKNYPDLLLQSLMMNLWWHKQQSVESRPSPSSSSLLQSVTAR